MYDYGSEWNRTKFGTTKIPETAGKRTKVKP
jgi:hypothetical protein